MSTFVVLTHTDWTEAPRLRHQVAQLLLDHGHTVYWFERAAGPLGRRQGAGVASQGGSAATASARTAPHVVATRRLVHHQLRVAPPLHWANARFLVPQLRRFVQDNQIGPDATIINFNFDYYFLRQVFPQNRIITIINDDFESMSKLPFHGHITWALKRTCKMSDAVLAVSNSLVTRLRLWCDARLFVPWSVTPYQEPQGDASTRNLLLFWGFVNRRLDVDILERVSDHLFTSHPQFRILVVGPVEGKDGRAIQERLSTRSNIEFRGRTNLQDLPVDRILAAVIPYRRHPETDAIYQTNKTMQLLAHGLPLLISGMPGFVQLPFVVRLDGPGGVQEAIGLCMQRFRDWQPAIRAYLAENSPESRLHDLGAAS